MAETLTTYRGYVQAEVDDTSSRAASVINRSIKDTYNEILRKTAKLINGTTSETISTVIGTSSYTPVNKYQDVIAVHHLNNGNYDRLTQITREEFLDLYLNDNNGTPSRWYPNGSNIVLSPAPSTVGTIRVEGVEIPDTLTTQDSEIPVQYTDVLILGSVARFLGYEKDGLSTHYKGLYEMALNDMIQDLSTKTRTLRPPLLNRGRIRNIFR